MKRANVANEGRVCLTHPAHGVSLVMRTGREYCPHQEHDGLGKGKGKGRKKPTTPFLDKQQVILDAADQSVSA